jgi:hypothetical protein
MSWRRGCTGALALLMSALLLVVLLAVVGLILVFASQTRSGFYL